MVIGFLLEKKRDIQKKIKKKMPRNDLGIYTSPFGKQPAYPPGTVYDYSCGWSTHKAATVNNDNSDALVDVGTGESWT